MLLYKYRSLSNFRFIADILCFQRLYCAPYDKLNDPFEGFCYIKSRDQGDERSRRDLDPHDDRFIFVEKCEVSELMNKKASVHRVCSLSSDAKDVRMWALYADSCRGIVVEIDFPENIPQLHRVQYESPTPLPWFLESREDLPAHEVLIHKTSHWKHESEYRIITESDYWDVSGRIRRVIVGPRCTLDDRLLLEHLIPAGAALVKAEANDSWLAVIAPPPPDYKPKFIKLPLLNHPKTF